MSTLSKLFEFFIAASALVQFAAPALAQPSAIFDGKTFTGWEGNTRTVWRVEDGALVAGSLTARQERNDFLATRQQFENFDLSLKWRLQGTDGLVNGGVQFRTQRIQNNHEVIGYQADLGSGYDGALYDESRRNVVLARPSKEVLAKVKKPLGEWNDYRIRAEGSRIQIWLNGVQTVDYVEKDPTIARTGIIALQIHGGSTSLVEYKDIKIEVLPASPKGAASPPESANASKPAAAPMVETTSSVPSLPLEDKRVLLFSKRAGAAEEVTKEGITSLREIAHEQGFALEISDDPKVVAFPGLCKFRSVIVLGDAADGFDPAQREAFESYIQSGGGYIGIAATTPADWPWFMRLCGGDFRAIPSSKPESLSLGLVTSPETGAASGTSDRWMVADELVELKRVDTDAAPNLTFLDSSGKAQAAGWFHEFDGGRACCTVLGRTPDAFQQPAFRRYLSENIRWAGRFGQAVTFHPERRLPGDEHFSVTEIATGLNDPMAVAVMPNGELLLLERLGALKKISATGAVSEVARLIVTAAGFPQVCLGIGGRNYTEGGGLGLVIDPDYGRKNDFIYIYYSPPALREVPYLDFDYTDRNRLSRFRYDGTKLSDEVTLLEVPDDRAQNRHVGGGLAFGEDRQLYLSLGENSSPGGNAYATIDERPGQRTHDAQRTAANSNDLRGGILRIRINDKGDGYTIPAGNLYPPGAPRTRPEIFVKGCRNPWRIAWNSRTKGIAFGDVGPDAARDDELFGPVGCDTVALANAPGFFGWPYFRGDRWQGDKDYDTGAFKGTFSNDAVNDSPNNTGRDRLPPLQRPLLWYPGAASQWFPEMGTGGRTACVSVVYNQEGRRASYPAWFDNVLIVHEWMRGTLRLVKLGNDSRLESIQPFLSNARFKRPSHMAQDSDGNLFVVDYGSNWLGNHDGRLFKASFLGWQTKALPSAAASDQRLAGLDPNARGTRLIQSRGCVACHGTAAAVVGPAFSDVAKRYLNDNPAGEAQVAKSIKEGSSGKWGGQEVLMPAFSDLDAADLKEIIATLRTLNDATK